MKDQDILGQINGLVEEEHELRGREETAVLMPADAERLASIEVQLDRCWDLLRQRRARRDAGQDPGEATLRPADVVEHYQQ
ncbi:MAG: DUF2630 family protein [Candidatus Eremiobacteraeota bacterium]|nr:DUF2630 family protein [Candidatus Eremiobacteraeota bacterium]